ncbi:MAG: RNA polymerase sigma-70 factor [Planctomycetes bacterium]|nr:RNA polymerase sigma-70 factor [Planctomycetota bacterium]
MSDPTREFEDLRPELQRLAYRMLGTLSDADDVMQESYLRWISADRTTVQSARAYISSIVTRLCIDQRRAIETRKETYIGPWLPEPIVEAESMSGEPVEVAESVSLALMHVLETLTPVERAAYLLRKVFDYDYAEISEILGKSEANCRQLVSRSESHVLAERPRFEAGPEDVQRISNQFLHACSTGDLGGLVNLLSEDVVIYSDGGGKVTAALRPLEGIDRASRFLLGLFKKAGPTVEIVPIRVNGQAGYAAFDAGRLVTVWTMDIADNRIRRCFLIRNPDKLARVTIRT